MRGIIRYTAKRGIDHGIHPNTAPNCGEGKGWSCSTRSTSLVWCQNPFTAPRRADLFCSGAMGGGAAPAAAAGDSKGKQTLTLPVSGHPLWG